MANKIHPSFNIHQVRKDIKESNFGFYMRNKTQEEYNPTKIQFVSNWHEMAFTLRDMASLCDDYNISSHIFNLAHKIDHYIDKGKMSITSEELNDLTTFIKNGKKQYQESHFVDLTKY